MSGGTAIELPIAALRYVEIGTEIHWDDKDFIIARGMWGTGLGTRGLENWFIREEMKNKTCVVTLVLKGTSGKDDVGHRRERNDLLNFYKRHGFLQCEKNHEKATLVRKA